MIGGRYRNWACGYLIVGHRKQAGSLHHNLGVRFADFEGIVGRGVGYCLSAFLCGVRVV